jgi:hypothetical protein
MDPLSFLHFQRDRLVEVRTFAQCVHIVHLAGSQSRQRSALLKGYARERETGSLYHAVPAGASSGGNFGSVIVGERGWVTTMSIDEIAGVPESLLQEMQAADLPLRNG